MSCYHPLIGIDTGQKTESGKIKYFIRSKEQSANFQFEIDNNDHILIPCGKCIGCRLDYSRSWADRMMLELETAEKAIFVTLTYNNAHLPCSEYEEVEFDGYLPLNGAERLVGNTLYFPVNSTLNKRDCQLFMKKLRHRFDGKDGRPFRKISFFLSGEYGEHTSRPHYHAIIFGIGLDDFHDIKLHGFNELGQNYYISSYFSSIWNNGFCLLCDVSWKTCAYVSRYVTKKLNGALSVPNYAAKNRIQEFALMSRNPGIGRKYLEKHPDCLDKMNINLSTAEGGLKIQIPKYYYKQLKFIPMRYDKDKEKYIEHPEENILYDPEKYDRIMEDRKKFAENDMLIQLQKTGLSFLDYLEVKEQKKLNSVKKLYRKLET